MEPSVKNRKVLFVVPTLSVVGGIEHWLCEVTSFLKSYHNYVLYAYQTPKQVSVPCLEDTPLCLNESLTNNLFKKILKLPTRVFNITDYARLKQVDTIVVSADNFIVATLLARWFRLVTVKIVVVIHQDIMTHNKLSRVLLLWLLPKADIVVAVSQGVRSEVNKLLPRLPVKMIYNSINFSRINQLAKNKDLAYESGRINFVSIGRLESLKQFDHQIQSLSHLSGQINLHIVGAGRDELLLKEMVSNLGLNKLVTFHGSQSNVFPYLGRADALVLTSRYESFGLVLVEAMALGKPVIAYDCDYGPREIMHAMLPAEANFVVTPYGYLVRNGDIDALTSVFRRFIDGVDTFSSDKIMSRAKEFDSEIVAKEWQAIV